MNFAYSVPSQLSKPMLGYCQLYPWEQSSVEFWSNTKLSIHENASENIVCEMAAILSKGRWVKTTDLIYVCRLLVSGHLQKEADFYINFVEGGRTVKEFCNQVNMLATADVMKKILLSLFLCFLSIYMCCYLSCHSNICFLVPCILRDAAFVNNQLTFIYIKL